MSVPLVSRFAICSLLIALLNCCASPEPPADPVPVPGEPGAGALGVSLGRLRDWGPYRQRFGAKARRIPTEAQFAARGRVAFIVDLRIQVQGMAGPEPFAARCSLRFAPALDPDGWQSPAQALFVASGELDRTIRNDDWYGMQIAAQKTATELLTLAEERQQLAAAIEVSREHFEYVRDGHKIDDWKARMMLELVRSAQRGGLAGQSDEDWQPSFALRVSPLPTSEGDRVLVKRFGFENESDQELRFQFDASESLAGQSFAIERVVLLLVTVAETAAGDPRDALAAIKHQLEAVEVEILSEPLQRGEPLSGWSPAEFEGGCQVLASRFGFEVAYRGEPSLWAQRIREMRQLAVVQARSEFRRRWQREFVSAGARDGHLQDFWAELLKMRVGSQRDLIRLDVPSPR